MIFDRPVEVPVATVVPHGRARQLVADARRWTAARWRWLAPRTLPLFGALVGMLAVIGSANYLRDYGRRDDAPAPRLSVVVLDPPPTTPMLTIHGVPAVDVSSIAVPPSQCRVVVVPPVPPPHADVATR
jgi:hypothetical protein